MKNMRIPPIPGALALYALAAFYSALTAAYFVFGLYAQDVLPDKDAFFAAPLSLVAIARVAMSVAVACGVAVALAKVRNSQRPRTAALASISTFLLFGLNFATYQQDYIETRISAGSLLLVLAPSIVLLVWTGIGAQRYGRMFTLATVWIDGKAGVLLRGRLWRRSYAFWLFALCGLIAAAGFVSVALNQYAYIEPRYDTAVFENVFWNTLHGRIGWESIDRVNHLGVHFTPTLALFLPVYALFPHATTFLVAESLALVLATIPLWRLTRKITGSDAAAYALTFAYLIFPHTLGMNIHGFKELAFWPLLGFTYLLVVDEPKFYRNPWYWLVLVMTLGLKEEFPLTVAAISLVLWLKGRDRWAHTAIIVFSAVWFGAVTQAIMPAILGPAGHPIYGKGWLFAHYYETMLPEGQRNFFGFGANAVLNPVLTAQMLARPQVLGFLLDISLPLLFLPWLGGWNLLILLPSLFLTNALALIPGPTSTLSSYITYLVPWFYCTTYGWVRLRDRFPKATAIAHSDLLYGLVLVSVLLLSQSVRFSRPISPEQATLRHWLETRPTELRVMSSRCFLPLLSGRETIRSMDLQDDLSLLDLVIIETKPREDFCAWVDDPYQEVRKAVLATGDFVADPAPIPGVAVFRRVRPATHPG